MYKQGHPFYGPCESWDRTDFWFLRLENFTSGETLLSHPIKYLIFLLSLSFIHKGKFQFIYHSENDTSHFCSQSIKDKYNITVETSGCIATKNQTGYQCASPSPVVPSGLEAYDGTHSLLDIGCAYGINTLEALKLGIPTIAIDNNQGHLEVLQDLADENSYQNVTCLLGSLPNDILVPDDSLSGC